MVFFQNETAKFYEYNDSEEYNVFGEPLAQYEFFGEFPCDFQPSSSSDSLNEYGETLEDVFKMYLDINVPITPSMIVKISNYPDTYEIIGTPQRNNRIAELSHIKVLLKKQRRPTEVND